MSRIPLAAGTKIELCNAASKREVIIDRLIGQGANCLAYDAHCVNERGIQIAVRLKECYPMDADTERQGQTLCWRSEAECRGALERFGSACDILQQLKNDSSIGTHVSSGELFQGNGTLYTWMENNYAATFAHFQPKTLTELLEAILLLTKIVSRIHRSGYLHLDIKPENFLYTNDPAPFISLIDVDTLTSIQAIKAGHVPAVPYSQSYAAPEQLAGKLSRIDQRTDLFAIGAILFEQLFHRKVGNDDIGAFAEWDFGLPLFEDVDPKAARLIRTVLKKTIAAAVKRRYESAEGLINDLEQAIEASRWHPFLISNVPYNAYFQGRVEELKMVAAAFDARKHMVFLHGVGGIGKTTLAKAYAEKYAARYDTVMFKRYRADHQSMQAVLDEIEIQNFHGDSAEHMRQLRRLLDKHTLLIIDNYDVAVDDTEGLDELFTLQADILVTTRTDFSEILQQNAAIIDVDRLPEEELLNLFFHFGHITPQSSSAADAKEIIERVAVHTMAVELVARQIAASGMTLAQMRTALNEQGLLTMKDAVKVRAIKDEVIVKTTLPDIIRKLFSIATLNDIQQEVMRTLALLSHVFVTRKLYGMVFRDQSEYYDALNDLLERGWLQWDHAVTPDTDQSSFSMHPLVHEMVIKDLRPDLVNCKCLSRYMSLLCFELGNLESDKDNVEKSKENVITKFMAGISEQLDVSIPENLDMIIHWLREYKSVVDPGEFCTKESTSDLDHVDLTYTSDAGWSIPRYSYPEMKGLYTNLERNLETSQQPEWIALILLCASLNDKGDILYAFQTSEEENNRERENVFKHYKIALEIMGTLPEEKAYVYTVRDAKGNEQICEGAYNIRQRYKKLMYVYIAAAINRCFSYFSGQPYLKRDLEFYTKLAQDTYACYPELVGNDLKLLLGVSTPQNDLYDFNVQPDEQDERINGILQAIAMQLQKDTINHALKDFLNDDSILLIDKLRILEDGAFKALGGGMYFNTRFANLVSLPLSWEDAYELYNSIIQWLRNTLDSGMLTDEEPDIAEYALEEHECYLPLILYHIDKAAFAQNMNEIIDFYEKTIDLFYDKMHPDRSPYDMGSVFYFKKIRKVEEVLCLRSLSHAMLPYMEKMGSLFEKQMEKYQISQNSIPESINNHLMSFYNSIIDLATDSKTEDPANEREYEQIIRSYKLKINELLDIDFDLR